LTSALACDDCGAIWRCAECGLALGFSRVRKTLACQQCSRETPAPSVCAACGGRRISAFGWGAERVEHAMRRRFPRARIARYDPDAARGARLTRQTEDAAAADIVIGTRGALRLFPPGSLGLAGLITPDRLLRIPDFRAAERTFALAWAAAERVAADGHVVIQSQTPDHYAIRAVVAQDPRLFYREELRFRSELGYPPFRRLCRVTVQGRAATDARALADDCARRLTQAGVVVYPPSGDGRGLSWQLLAKGGDGLADTVAGALADLRSAPGVHGRDKIGVEMDPVE
jgi:primosomal protein N' (replication factor Y)